MQTYHFEHAENGNGLVVKPGQYKVSRKAKERRTRLIGRTMVALTILYVIAALVYTYRIDIAITLR